MSKDIFFSGTCPTCTCICQCEFPDELTICDCCTIGMITEINDNFMATDTINVSTNSGDELNNHSFLEISNNVLKTESNNGNLFLTNICNISYVEKP
ncbi:hypothetical protein [Bacillus sp. SM2101]|uniref:hypothetical protein n=1 Tax=Bacillus sp. SM2101 TaxID=2805366 RepID=UPI001BDF4D2F|nr:hypothetical protein [Bacillus sp. SM2101]